MFVVVGTDAAGCREEGKPGESSKEFNAMVRLWLQPTGVTRVHRGCPHLPQPVGEVGPSQWLGHR